jgi:hypothetical protein
MVIPIGPMKQYRDIKHFLIMLQKNFSYIVKGFHFDFIMDGLSHGLSMNSQYADFFYGSFTQAEAHLLPCNRVHQDQNPSHAY